eukprot:TRINITY_DN512_c0_g5_i1.p1 TRINITY_DN512_c0_g5~~TRINITY_DN512_c0_g5_i1.p1  ORF type:complete len:196 (-),score=35.03 TRINITY_DN512_c0_g5_i1:579-1166(-)
MDRKKKVLLLFLVRSRIHSCGASTRSAEDDSRLLKLLDTVEKAPRSFVPRSAAWWKLVLDGWDDQEFSRHFRVSRTTFDVLASFPNLRKLANHVKKLSVCLWFLATGEGVRELGERFALSKSSVSRAISEITEAFLDIPTLSVRFPNPSELEKVAEGFDELCGIPGVVGAVDGSHIPIQKPGAAYYPVGIIPDRV